MSDQLSLDPQHEARPFTQHRHKSHLPPHERKSNTTVPVTPGISAGTYTESANRLGTKDKLSKDYSLGSQMPLAMPKRHLDIKHQYMPTCARAQASVEASTRPWPWVELSSLPLSQSLSYYNIAKGQNG